MGSAVTILSTILFFYIVYDLLTNGKKNYSSMDQTSQYLSLSYITEVHLNKQEIIEE
jgi:hypothetical protein